MSCVLAEGFDLGLDLEREGLVRRRRDGQPVGRDEIRVDVERRAVEHQALDLQARRRRARDRRRRGPADWAAA